MHGVTRVRCRLFSASALPLYCNGFAYPPLLFTSTAGSRHAEGEFMAKQATRSGNMHIDGGKNAGGSDLTARDPVCGMVVNPASARRVEHAGKAYYFCSASCESKFQSAPDQYTGPMSVSPGHQHTALHAHAT